MTEQKLTVKLIPLRAGLKCAAGDRFSPCAQTRLNGKILGTCSIWVFKKINRQGRGAWPGPHQRIYILYLQRDYLFAGFDTMSFFTQPVTIPMWFLLMMNIIAVALLVKLFMLVYRYRRGEISKEEHSDMVVWKVQTTKRSPAPQQPATTVAIEKQQEQKQDLVQVLKILIHEGDRGVLMQTIADRMEMSRSNAHQAMQKLVKNKMVDEVVGISGTKYYLTQQGRDYCMKKSK